MKKHTGPEIGKYSPNFEIIHKYINLILLESQLLSRSPMPQKKFCQSKISIKYEKVGDHIEKNLMKVPKLKFRN